jgi:hypothetical protein
VEVCCELQSALHETVRNTLVIHDIKPGETIQLALHGAATTRALDVPAIMARKQPVQLQYISLAPSGPAAAAPPQPQVDNDAKAPETAEPQPEAAE